MNESSNDELRALLKSAEFSRGTPVRSTQQDGSSDVPLDELAYLISSLDIDLGTPLKVVRNRSSVAGGSVVGMAGTGAGIASARPPQPLYTPTQVRSSDEVRFNRNSYFFF